MEEGLVILEEKEGSEEAKAHQQFLQEYKFQPEGEEVVLALIAMEDEDENEAQENLDELQAEEASMEGDMDGFEDHSSAFEEVGDEAKEEGERKQAGTEESKEEVGGDDGDDDEVYEENLLCCAVCGLPPEPPMLRCWEL